MDDDQDMGGGDVSKDENYQWTEIRASTNHDDQPEFPHNLGSLNVYDPAMVSMGCQIGEGAQAFIFEALFYLPFSFKPLPVVVKRFKPLEGVSQGQFPPEMASAKCLSVCKPLGVVFKENSLCIIMQRYSCDLRAHIDAHMHALQDAQCGYKGPPFPSFESEHMLLQLAMGMKGLHELGIYHRDLKAANILVTRHSHPDGKPCPISELHITDFERSEDVLGTGFYRAPEVLQSGAEISHHQWLTADIYSFGMVCYEVLTGRIPFDGHPYSDHDLVIDGARPELPDHVPAKMKSLIRRCWQADPESRPSWTDIVHVLNENSNEHGRLLAILDEKSSIDANLSKLKRLIHVHINGCESREFVDYIYWAEEFVANAEEYVSKFDVEFPSGNGIMLCKWQEFVERRQLDAVLFHQFLAYPATITQSSKFLSEFWKGREQIRSLMMSLIVSIDSQLRQVRCVDEVDEEVDWMSRVLFLHAFIKWQLWTEVVCPAFGGASIVRLLAQLVNPRDGVNEFIFFACLIVVAGIETYLYVLAVFTYEPIVLCLQYGLYRIKGCNSFLYRSSGYRVCRLQRAWVNYTRHRLLSAALILSFIYLVTTSRWKGFLGWIVIPSISRFSPYYWRQAILG
jgi:serine/threonine protein kinase